MDKATIKYVLETDKSKSITEIFNFKDGMIDIDERLGKIFQLVKENIWNNTLEEFIRNIGFAFDSVYNRIDELNDDKSIDNDELAKAPANEWFKVFMKDFNFGLFDYVEDEDCEEFVVLIPSKDKRSIATTMTNVSLALYIVMEDDIFYPVLFGTHYYKFEERCSVLGITLPKIPRQKDKEQRIQYYVEVCGAIESFREEYNLTKEEVCSLIYGYSADVCDSSDLQIDIQNLPSPTRIWLTGASKEDIRDGYIDKPISVWACNEKTRKGDIVVVYALSPYSRIHSVWRAVADGNVNPFDYYTNRATVGHRIDVPAVTYKDLKEDAEMGQVPVVRRGLIGINGVELTYDDYQILLRMFREKGMDTSILPNLEAPNMLIDNPEIKREADVSYKLLVPMLSKLGYSEEPNIDWYPELRLKVGRDKEVGEHGSIPRPDFSFFVEELGAGLYAAPMVIECKYDMSDNADFNSAFYQAFSYARQLNSRIMGVCDKYVLRLYEADKNGNFFQNKEIFNSSWKEINTKPEVFNKLSKLIGRDVISRK